MAKRILFFFKQTEPLSFGDSFFWGRECPCGYRSGIQGEMEAGGGSQTGQILSLPKSLAGFPPPPPVPSDYFPERGVLRGNIPKT